ncbi:LysR family transcriptional regulator [Bosea sp. (in: a-proteobacteria)]|uniref:LysR family transcriptional regulator n=1 Tax=Bosea sp. (in: a-proteobacteria) TaxID=1871050 RepID=UPI0026150218|nr:LysR family transcriptional regulator [Bosea sp. (in: a-proteobacteria)]MCO5091336.1 LysR family transcriptional regulator [Bosea sp. (in: a-proteobacteria)]
MTLKQLQAFYWICRMGGFSAAAKRLNSTQTAISMRIRELEQSFGVKLFERGGRELRMTSKGRELYPLAEELLEKTARIQSAISDPASMSGMVHLGVTDFIAVTWLPLLVRAIEEKFPNVLVEMDVDLGPNIQHKIDSAEVDLALMPGPLPGRHYLHRHLGSVEFAWMASPSLGVPDKLAHEDLEQLPHLSLRKASNSYNLVQDWLSARNIRFRRTYFCANMQVLISLTLDGLGISHLPLDYVRPHIESGRLRVISIPPDMESLEYYAIFDPKLASVIVQSVADLAVNCSSFQ